MFSAALAALEPPLAASDATLEAPDTAAANNVKTGEPRKGSVSKDANDGDLIHHGHSLHSQLPASLPSDAALEAARKDTKKKKGKRAR